MDKSAAAVNISEFLGPRLNGLQRIAMGLGVIGAVLCVLGWFLDPAFYPKDPFPFFHAYLYAYLFWMGATGGALILLMVHHVVGGGWGFVIRRFLEAATRLLPLMVLLFVPIIVGLLWFHLYSGTAATPGWYSPQAATIPALRTKISYLNVPSYLLRTAFYFLCWYFLVFFLNKWGATQDSEGSVEVSARLNYLSSFGLVAYALTASFASFDWVMSLTPTWYSTIFGLLFLVSQALTGMGLILFLFGRLAGDKPLTQEVPRGYFRDLGNLLLMLILLWAYMSFSQYLLTFTGDSIDEISWYITRGHNGWGFISLALIPIHFFLPFMTLLAGSGLKRNPIKLGWLAFYVVLMRLMELWWWVTPTFRPQHISLGLCDVGAPLLLGGIWLWFWAFEVKGKPMVPVRDPRVEGHWREVVEHG